jgi:hypothetical protein
MMNLKVFRRKWSWPNPGTVVPLFIDIFYLGEICSESRLSIGWLPQLMQNSSHIDLPS